MKEVDPLKFHSVQGEEVLKELSSDGIKAYRKRKFPEDRASMGKINFERKKRKQIFKDFWISLKM